MESGKSRIWICGVGAALALLVSGVLPAASGAELVKIAQWGGGLPETGLEARAIEVDSSDRVYVADSFSGRIVRIEADGDVNLAWPVERSEDPEVNPVDLALDDAGNVYSLDQGRKRVDKFTADGVSLGGWPVDVPVGAEVRGIAWTAGSVFVLGGNMVRRYSPDGMLVDSWGAFGDRTYGILPMIEGSSTGHLYVAFADFYGGFSVNRTIEQFDPDGQLNWTWSGPGNATVIFGHDVVNFTNVSGFDGIASAADGSIWGGYESADPFFRKYGPAGPEPSGVGTQVAIPDSFDVDSTGNFYIDRDNLITRLDHSGSSTRSWSNSDFPKYTRGLMPGRFRSAGDLTVRSDGVVGIFDESLVRTQTFSGAGDYLGMIDLGGIPYGYRRPVFLMPDTGGAEYLWPGSNRLDRYSEQGVLLGQTDLQLPKNVLDASIDPGHGYAVLSSRAPGDARVTLVDKGGSVTGGFPVGEDRPSEMLTEGRVEVDPSGSVLVMGRNYIRKLSPEGVVQATWEMPSQACEKELVLDDIAVDGRGRVYAIGLRSGQVAVFAFDARLNEVWEEPVPVKDDYLDRDRFLDIGPDGSIFLDAGDGIERFKSPQSGKAPPGDCSPKGSDTKFALSRVAYGPGRRTALLKLTVPEPGRISVKGRKVVTVNRAVSASGSYRVRVKLRPRFARRRASSRLVAAQFTIGFRSAVASEAIARRIRLRVPAIRARR